MTKNKKSPKGKIINHSIKVKGYYERYAYMGFNLETHKFEPYATESEYHDRCKEEGWL